ncbi:17-beta-hydroxysteroid dehydrogenase 13-like isoform X1 [Maniola jurtina]|uniref:17-beta-hydroxysteroid dehydrogenase 13-like isoform X1 n=1 Tax=Maniola jurtina TaxID=191418 RepID=UPI001E68BB23|nr:17-beta-hydroxysteroid dehydrogenase 13-like isoform X1 [Maniola jurtina]
MRRRNIFVRCIGFIARKFRALQEVWILPWWGGGGLVTAPLWALDAFVLVVKICSTCAMAVFRVFIPPAMKSLYGETVLITGAGGGIGRELAIQFAELGATVVCWDIDARRNNAVVNEIRKKDGDCFGYTVDVTVREQVLALAAHMRRQLTDISIVVSNAGALTCAPLTNLRPETVARLVEVNLLAHFWVIQAFLPNMIERQQGHIVAINSSAGLMPCADMVPYCAAKFGLRGLMDSLSEELRLDTWTKNINTTSVYLASISTGLYPPPTHRFVYWYSEITAQEAARIIIEGIRKNKKCISIPSLMKSLIDLNNLMPYRIRIIFADFFNFGHRGWFCFC